MNAKDEIPPVPHEPWMKTPPQQPLSQEATVRQAVSYGAVVILVTLAVFFVAGASSGGLRTTLLIVGPAVMLIGAIGALWRTYKNWKSGGRWQIWQGASWFLLAAFIMTLMGTAPALMG